MALVHAKEPVIVKTDDGPTVIDPKEAYDSEDEIVKQYPQFFAGDKTLSDRGEGKSVSGIQSTNDGQRGRVK